MQFEVVHALTDEQTRRLYELYNKEWWSKKRTYAEVEHVLAHSLSVALIEKTTKALIAYSRVVTDRRYFAYILDVIVDEAFRGKKLGARLMQAILLHPELANVNKFELKCLPELEPFYKKCGFEPLPSDFVTMVQNLKP